MAGGLSCEVFGQLFGESQGVEGMQGVEQGEGAGGLGALQVSDEVPANGVRGIGGDLGGFFPEGLWTVFGEVSATEVVEGLANFLGDGFGDRHEGHFGGVASGPKACGSDVIVYFLEIFRDAGHRDC